MLLLLVLLVVEVVGEEGGGAVGVDVEELLEVDVTLFESESGVESSTSDMLVGMCRCRVVVLWVWWWW